MEYLKTVGNNIKYYRQIADMSQDELAQKSGYSGRGAISKIEAGERDIAQSKIKLIADALGVTVWQLMDERHTENDYYDTKIITALKGLDEKAQMLVLYALGFENGMNEIMKYLNKDK